MVQLDRERREIQRAVRHALNQRADRLVLDRIQFPAHDRSENHISVFAHILIDLRGNRLGKSLEHLVAEHHRQQGALHLFLDREHDLTGNRRSQIQTRDGLRQVVGHIAVDRLALQPVGFLPHESGEHGLQIGFVSALLVQQVLRRAVDFFIHLRRQQGLFQLLLCQQFVSDHAGRRACQPLLSLGDDALGERERMSEQFDRTKRTKQHFYRNIVRTIANDRTDHRARQCCKCHNNRSYLSDFVFFTDIIYPPRTKGNDYSVTFFLNLLLFRGISFSFASQMKEICRISLKKLYNN